jgi:hypothetical protein
MALVGSVEVNAVPISKWTERSVCHVLAFNTFGECLCVPNCGWAGYEADLLVVTRSLKLIDVEIKLSKDDLKADKHKGKWQVWNRAAHERQPLAYPRRVWKHYVAVPEDLWQDSWLEHCQLVSGVLLVRRWGRNGDVRSIRRAKADPTGSYTLTNSDVVHIAKLASFRMWNALESLHGCLTKQVTYCSCPRDGLRPVSCTLYSERPKAYFCHRCEKPVLAQSRDEAIGKVDTT